MTAASPESSPCPQCGSAVLARRRLRAGRSGAPGRLHLRCASPTCAWRARVRWPADGLARGPGEAGSAQMDPGAPARDWRAPLRISAVLSVLALCVASSLAVVALVGVSAMAAQPEAFGVPPGTSHDGRPVVAAAGAGAASPQADGHGLALRKGCRWGEPGRDPYRGTTRQALMAAGLPEDVVRQIVDQQQAGQRAGRLEIRRDGIHHTTEPRVFAARGFALTFGMTLCRDARVNFAKGHVEPADLYEARDAQGRLHSVMVPDVCGNVSVIGPQAATGRVAGASAALADRAAGLFALAQALDASAAGGAAVGVAGAAGAAGAADAAGLQVAQGAQGAEGTGGAEAAQGGSVDSGAGAGAAAAGASAVAAEGDGTRAEEAGGAASGAAPAASDAPQRSAAASAPEGSAGPTGPTAPGGTDGTDGDPGRSAGG